MEHHSSRFVVEPERSDQAAIAFCEKFLLGKQPRYVFGCNAWAQSIAQQVAIDGFIDDVVPNELFCGKLVMRSGNVPKNSLVVSAVVLGRPLTALLRISELGLAGLDYFSFQKYSGLDLDDVLFLGEFGQDFSANRHRYEWLFSKLADAESRHILNKLVNFRLSRDLNFMDGFTDAQYRQYFEPFLALRADGECFLDVGSYDGFTSSEFIRRCPEYRHIHVFEPEPSNMETVKSRLAESRNIQFHPYGVSDTPQTLRFKSAGSASVVSDDGKSSIDVKRIDDVISEPYSFLKMDIEGGELAALKGASQTIAKYHPRLAISVYHKADDMWRIPEEVLQLRNDYNIYLRHYTEGVTETVMFFVPV